MDKAKKWTKNPNNKLYIDFSPKGMNISKDF